MRQGRKHGGKKEREGRIREREKERGRAGEEREKERKSRRGKTVSRHMNMHVVET